MANKETLEYLSALNNMRNNNQKSNYDLVNPSNDMGNVGNDISSFAYMNTPVKSYVNTEVNTNKEKASGNWWTRLNETIGEFTTNVNTGALNFIDGLVDFGLNVDAMIKSSLGFDDLAQQNRDMMNYDWVTTTAQVMSDLQSGGMANGFFTQSGANMWESSYWEDLGARNQQQRLNSYSSELGENQKWVTNIEQGIGNVLPSIAIGAATGGLGLAPAMAQGISIGATSLSAAGNTASEKVQDGASDLQAFQAGLIGGAIEAGSEFITAGIGKGINAIAGKTITKFGNKVAGIAFDEVEKLSLKSLAKSGFEEGVEEVFSDILSPLSDLPIKDGKEVTKDLFNWTPEEMEEMGMSFVGGAVGGILGTGMQSAMLTKTIGNDGIDIINKRSEIEALKDAQVKELKKGDKANAKIVEEYKLKAEKLGGEIGVLLDNLSSKNPTQFNNLTGLIHNDKNAIQQMKNEYMKMADGYQAAASDIATRINKMVASDKPFSIEIVKDNDFANTTKGKIAMKGNEAFIDPNTNKVYIADSSKGIMYNLVGHEVLAHGIVEQNPETFKSIESWAKSDNKIKEYWTKAQEMVEKKGYKSSVKNAETMAHFLQQFVNNDKQLNKIVRANTNTTVKEKILSTLQKIMNNLSTSQDKELIKVLNDEIESIKSVLNSREYANENNFEISYGDDVRAKYEKEIADMRYSVEELEKGARILFNKEENAVRFMENSDEWIKLKHGDIIALEYRKSKNRHRARNEWAPTLTTKSGALAIYDNGEIRKLTPREYWKLMGFSNENFDKVVAAGVPKTDLYKQAGNSIAMPVLESIVKNLGFHKNKIIKVEEHFAGIGTLTTALKNAGYKVKHTGVVEKNANAVKSFNAIHNTNFKPSDIVEYTKNTKPHYIDICLFGSPCVDNSTANTKGIRGYARGSDTKSSLFWNSFDWLMKAKPNVIIWENVPTVATNKKLKPTYDEVVRILEENGYTVSSQILDARDFGVPQSRRRNFLVARKDGKTFEFAKGDRTNLPSVPEYLGLKENDNKTKDISYSKSLDSDGNKLTEQQEKYFENSKARDENGNLSLVYHGTKKGGFTIFDNSKNGRYRYGGNAVSFFTTSRLMAKSYASNNRDVNFDFKNKEYSLEDINKKLKKLDNSDGKDYKIVQIGNGYIWERINIFLGRKEQFGQYFQIKNIDDPNERFETIKDAIEDLEDLTGNHEIFYDSVEEMANDTNGGIYKGYLDIRNPLIVEDAGRWDMIDSPFDEDKGKEIVYTTDEIVNKAIEKGTYDGVIFRDVWDYAPNLTESEAFDVNENPEDNLGDVYVTLKSSNQFKSFDNKKPTLDKDIRYSKKYPNGEVKFDGESFDAKNFNGIWASVDGYLDNMEDNYSEYGRDGENGYCDPYLKKKYVNKLERIAEFIHDSLMDIIDPSESFDYEYYEYDKQQLLDLQDMLGNYEDESSFYGKLQQVIDAIDNGEYPNDEPPVYDNIQTLIDYIDELNSFMEDYDENYQEYLDEKEQNEKEKQEEQKENLNENEYEFGYDDFLETHKNYSKINELYYQIIELYQESDNYAKGSKEYDKIIKQAEQLENEWDELNIEVEKEWEELNNGATKEETPIQEVVEEKKNLPSDAIHLPEEKRIKAKTYKKETTQDQTTNKEENIKAISTKNEKAKKPTNEERLKERLEREKLKNKELRKELNGKKYIFSSNKVSYMTNSLAQSINLELSNDNVGKITKSEMERLSNETFKVLTNDKITTEDELVNKLYDVILDTNIVNEDGYQFKVLDIVDLSKGEQIKSLIRENYMNSSKQGTVAELNKLIRQILLEKREVEKLIRENYFFNKNIKQNADLVGTTIEATGDNTLYHTHEVMMKPFVNVKHTSKGRFYIVDGLKENLNELLSNYNEDNFKKEFGGLAEYDENIRNELESLRDSITQTYKSDRLTSDQLRQSNKIIKMIDSKYREQRKKGSVDYRSNAIAISKDIKNNQSNNKFVIGMRTALLKTTKVLSQANSIITQIFGANSVGYDVLVRQMQDAESQSRLYKGELLTQIKDKINSYGLLNTLGKKFKEVTFNGNIHLTYDETIFLYNALKTQENFDVIDTDGVVIRTNSGKYIEIIEQGKAQETLDLLEEKLPKEYKELASFYKDLFNDNQKITLNGEETSLGNEYKKWYKETYNTDTNEVGDYWTLYRAYHKASNAEKMVKTPAMFKRQITRRKNNNQMLIMSATNTATSYIEQLATEKFVKPKYRESIKMLNTKLEDGKTSVIEMIDKMYSDKESKYITDTLNAHLGAYSYKDDVYNKLMSAYSVSALSMKVTTVLKQPLSLFTSNLNQKYIGKSLLKIIGKEETFTNSFNKLLNEIGDAKYRTNEAILGQTGYITGTREKLANIGMYGTKVTDNLSIKIGLGTLMLEANALGYKIGTTENENWVKEHFSDFILTQIGSGANSQSGASRGDYGHIGKAGSMMQGANRAMLSSIIYKLDIYSKYRNAKLEDFKIAKKQSQEKISISQEEFDAKGKILTDLQSQIVEDRLERDRARYEYNQDKENEYLQEEYYAAKEKVENDKEEIKKIKEEMLEISHDIINETATLKQANVDIHNYEEYKAMGGLKGTPINMALGFVINGTMIALINALGKRLLGKKDWGEDDKDEVLQDALLSGFIEWIPMMSNLTSYIKGYDITDPSAEMINTLLGTAKSVYQFATGELSQKDMYDNITTLLGFMGLPAKTIIGYMQGLVRTFDYEEYVKFSNLFYGASESYEKIKFNGYVNDNNRKAGIGTISYISSTFSFGEMDNYVANEIFNLKKDGYATYPKSIPTSYTNENGENVQLSQKELNTFKKTYSAANKGSKDMTRLTDYRSMSSKDKSKALRKLFDAYYYYSLYKATGVKQGNEQLIELLEQGVDISKIVLGMVNVNNTKATQTTTKKQEIVKMLNSMSLTKKEKLLVLQVCGYSTK